MLYFAYGSNMQRAAMRRRCVGARAWKLPEAYVRSVERWSVSRWTGARAIDARGTRMSEEPIIIRHVLVRGRVQGVGFRAFVEHHALQRGLSGWVRNRRDGAVEAVFAGPAKTVNGMISACRVGPLSGRVDVLDQREASDGELDKRTPGALFSVLPTA